MPPKTQGPANLRRRRLIQREGRRRTPPLQNIMTLMGPIDSWRVIAGEPARARSDSDGAEKGNGNDKAKDMSKRKCNCTIKSGISRLQCSLLAQGNSRCCAPAFVAVGLA